MQEQIVFPETNKPEFDLGPVRLLLDYLHALPQGYSDRELSPSEDERACDLLHRLTRKNDCPQLQWFVEYYTELEYRQCRTLCVWYCIARSIAFLIQDCSCDC